MNPLQVTFIENVLSQVRVVENILGVSGYFKTELIESYDEVTYDLLKETDLFVLDVLMNDNRDDDFCRFLPVLVKNRKPFIAFTTKTDKSTLKSLPGEPDLRRTVLEHGGIGVISKRVPPGEEAHVSRLDMEVDLAESILKFYWSHR